MQLLLCHLIFQKGKQLGFFAEGTFTVSWASSFSTHSGHKENDYDDGAATQKPKSFK